MKLSFYNLHDPARENAFTLAELMIALPIGIAAAGAALFLYIFLYRGMYDTTSELQAQSKANAIIEKIARGPMGTFGGIHSVYFNANGTPGNPNPTITTVSTSPTNQTFSFYVQTNYSGFAYISLTNYLDTSVAALYTIGYDTNANMVYYTVNNGSKTSLETLPSNILIGRFMFIQTNSTLPEVQLAFDILIPKSNGTVTSNSYTTLATFRNNPQE